MARKNVCVYLKVDLYEAGRAAGINFSHLLNRAIREELGIPEPRKVKDLRYEAIYNPKKKPIEIIEI